MTAQTARPQTKPTISMPVQATQTSNRCAYGEAEEQRHPLASNKTGTF
jgi:hypothetical protein